MKQKSRSTPAFLEIQLSPVVLHTMTAVQLGIDLGAKILWAPLILLILLIKLSFWIQVLYLQRPTLSSVPGPKWAAWTRMWIVKVLASGESAQTFVDVNKRYGEGPNEMIDLRKLTMKGSLARIGPKHLITSDPAFMRRILAARSGYTRGPWFDSIRIDPHTPNIVSERDEKKHSQLRYKLAASVRSVNRYPTNLLT